MFIETLHEFKTNETELHRQAAYSRLVKSVEKRDPWTAIVFITTGRLLIESGQQIINRYQTAQ